MGFPLPPAPKGAAVFASVGPYGQMPDGTVLNFAHITRVSASGKNLVVTYPTKDSDQFPYASETLAAGALQGISDFLGSMSGILTLRSITPATAVASSTVNAVLIGTGFQYDIPAGTFLAVVKVGGNTATVTFVNSSTLLLQFTAPNPAGAYDVTYAPNIGSTVTLVGGWTSS